MRFFVILFFLFVSFQSIANPFITNPFSLDLFQSNTKATPVTITQSQYIVSGISELIVGFGVGHAMQGRYFNRGWFFTAAPILVYAVGMGISSLIGKGDVSQGVVRVSLSLVTALRIWGIVDVWMLPNHYRVKKDRNPKFFSNKDFISLDVLNYRW